jgi:hypothetical protein
MSITERVQAELLICAPLVEKVRPGRASGFGDIAPCASALL